MLPTDRTRPGAADLLILVPSLALISAGLELLGLAYLRFGEGKFLFVGREVVWMVPLSHLALLSLIGMVLLAGGRRVESLGSWRVVGLGLAASAALSALLVFHPRLHLFAIAVLATGVGVTFSRTLAERPAPVLRLLRRTLPLLVPLALLGAAWPTLWRRTAESRALAALPAAPATGPNVLVLFLDVVRADHLSLYGYHRPTTPNIDRFAQGGVVFTRAIAPSSWTLPSHASALSGRWPAELSADWSTPLDRAHPTLAEVLSAAGYRTGGFVGNTRFLSYETGMQRGFTRYVDYVPSAGATIAASALGRYLNYNRRLKGLLGSEWKVGRRTAGQVRVAFEEWLAETDPERPFFAFLNFLDAHNPYTPPASHAGRFGGPTGTATLRARLASVVRPQPAFRTDSAGLDRAQRSYDESIAYMDEEFGKLIAGLERRGMLQNTVVIVTGDHGELFGEHGLVDHGNSLYFPLLHVPLVATLPGQIPAGVQVTAPVSLRDLPATVLDLTGVDAGPQIPGVSLRAAWAGGAGRPPLSPAVAMITGDRAKAPQLPISRGDMAALVADSLLLIRNGDGALELYAVSSPSQPDPDLAATPELAPTLQSLAERLNGWFPVPFAASTAEGRGSQPQRR